MDFTLRPWRLGHATLELDPIVWMQKTGDAAQLTIEDSGCPRAGRATATNLL
jgi:hypothetical protein